MIYEHFVMNSTETFRLAQRVNSKPLPTDSLFSSSAQSTVQGVDQLRKTAQLAKLFSQSIYYQKQRWINSKLQNIQYESSEFMNLECHHQMQPRFHDDGFISRQRSIPGNPRVNPINLDVRNSSKFKNWVVIGIVDCDFFQLLCFLIYISPGISKNIYNYIFEVLTGLDLQKNPIFRSLNNFCTFSI